MCKFCNIVANRELLEMIKLYEDERSIAVLSKKPASIAHVIVFPKAHYTIIEQVPDEEIKHLFNICNKISIAMFESINIQGTNILVQNGIPAGQEDPHFCIHIISRFENDNLRLSWEPKKLSEEEMATIELRYKQFTEGIIFSDEKTKTVEIKKQEDKNKKQEIKEEKDKENYLIKYFNRIP